MPKVFFQDLGLIDYKVCWDYQEKLFNEIIAQKLEQRNRPDNYQLSTNHYLLFCEHPHVYTLGRNGDEKNLLIHDEELKKAQAVFYKNNRGGDITYHGPGQIVGYPILNLDLFFTDIHKYLRYLEEAVIRTLLEYGINAGRIPKLTGVWVDAESNAPRKICSFGVRCSRWVTMHGFAFNVNTDLSYFSNIVPCGIADKEVTSMQKELGKEIDIEEVKSILKKNIAELFGMELIAESAHV
ncbi:MAG TPA: lipoyl(octanoyl) transferase LipB [Bacteroidia bacterium]|nr:lipoyl(octanoyl) transferase LipB [Bacteroidia bacterium]